VKVSLGWQISSFFGWGVYGLNLALEWASDPTVEASTSWPLDLKQIAVDPLRRRALRPFVTRSFGPRPRDAIAIAALGNDGDGVPEQIAGARVAAIFFEQPLSDAAIERLKRYDLIIAGSTWNGRLLRDRGLSNVRVILQGVDPTLFHPARKRDLFPGRFVIFSGGKAEPRKGQDLVVKAFRIFAARHDDAMLVTAWHSPWPALRDGMDLDLTEFADRVIDVGAVPNALLAPVLRECDVALFPNRAEGGTNLVAMECLACGVPTILSANTGHLDLATRAYMLERQTFDANGWGSSDVEEIVETLELAHRLPWEPAKVSLVHNLTWSHTAAELKHALEDIHGRSSQAA